MFIADLKGKLSVREEYSEDFLTSAVFSIFELFPEKYFELFLRSAVNFNGDHFDINCKNFSKFIFWKRFSLKHSTGVEPDIVVLFDKIAIIVEAKLYSGKSGVGFLDENNEISKIQLKQYLIDQLAREYYLGKELVEKRQVSSDDTTYDVTDFFLLYLTKDSVFPEHDIHETIKTILKLSSYDAEEAKSKIYWTKWQEIIPIMRNLLNDRTLDSIEYKLSAQLIKFLTKRDLVDFTGFAFLDHVPLFRDLIKENDIFYTSLSDPYFIDSRFSKQFDFNESTVFYESVHPYFIDSRFSKQFEFNESTVFYKQK